MKILYVHHAERDHTNKNIDRKLQDITENGITESNLLAEKLKQIEIKAIYSSPYLRCIHTAQIINKYNNAPIYEEPRLNELNNSETWKEFQIRHFEFLDEIIEKHNEDDVIVCISSGVNLSAFVYYFTKQEPSNDNPWIQALTISPVLFSTNNKVF